MDDERVIALHFAPTGEVSAATLGAIRALLDRAFPGDFSDDDWQHALGGLHVWLADGQQPISHGSLVERTVTCSERSFRVGFVEAVATAESYRRRGHGARVMRAIGDEIVRRYPLGVLSTGAYAFYGPLGWERWRGPTFVDAPTGRRRTPEDDDDVMILRTPVTPALDLDGPIVCDWRSGDVW